MLTPQSAAIPQVAGLFMLLVFWLLRINNCQRSKQIRVLGAKQTILIFATHPKNIHRPVAHPDSYRENKMGRKMKWPRSSTE